MNYRIILHTLGWVMISEAASMLLPMICALIYGEKCITVFLICALLCLIAGVILTKRKPENKTMYAKEGYIAVALSWIIISVFGAFPFVFTDAVPSFIYALFETVSGFTTTGASILSDIDALPRSLVLWRSFTHWIGGMGVLVLLVAILPLSGSGNLYLIKAESPGPSVSKLVPKVKHTAAILYCVYLSFTVLEFLFLFIGGMEFFDSLTMAFGTAGTGGFAVRNSGMADYTAYHQIVITVFMIIFGVDFSFYYLILNKKIKSALKMEEVRTYFCIILTAVVIICINCRGFYESIGETIRHSAFQVGSIITTTGFSTVDFNKWPELSKHILVILMFVGACAGSTGGGMKVSRMMLLFKSIIKEVKIQAQPKSTHKVKFNSRPVEHETVRSINVYAAAYFFIFVVSFLIISLDNFDFTTNFTAVAATLNNIGPGLNRIGPMENFACYSPLSTFVLTIDMLIGRLEIFPILVLFSPYTWKK